VLRELLPKEREKKCPFLNIKDPLTDHLVLRANFVGSILNKPAAARCCPGCHNRRGAADGASSSADQSLSSSPHEDASDTGGCTARDESAPLGLISTQSSGPFLN
jgi:hypothetical protein